MIFLPVDCDAIMIVGIPPEMSEIHQTFTSECTDFNFTLVSWQSLFTHLKSKT